MDFKYVRNVNFSGRYILPSKLFGYLEQNYPTYIEQIGKATLGMPVYKFSFGKGKIKIIAWSQMHGNESTATLAMLDLLSTFDAYPELKFYLEDKISLDFIFMLNPYGACVWERRNAVGIDVNRDFLKKSSVEMRLLQDFISREAYNYALNLHDQRTVFSTDGTHPATLSFLAPSEDEERSLTETRKKSMAIISAVYNKLKNEIPDYIGRYTDVFYPFSVGDNLTKIGLPTILFEGGHYPNDYLRKNTRKYYTQALYLALEAIGNLAGETSGFETYFTIPENKETHFDIIYRNITIEATESCVVDIAVQYQETYIQGNDEISFIPYIVEIGDCSHKKAWQEIDCTGKSYKSAAYPKINEIANFEIH